MACKRAVTAAGRSLGDLTTRHPVTADQILSVLLRLYRQRDIAMSRSKPLVNAVSGTRATSGHLSRNSVLCADRRAYQRLFRLAAKCGAWLPVLRRTERYRLSPHFLSREHEIRPSCRTPTCGCCWQCSLIRATVWVHGCAALRALTYL